MSHTDRRRADRRVGERVPASLPVEVKLTTGGSTLVAAATILDVSISGCRLLAPLPPSVAVGTIVVLDSSGRTACGVIRRAEVGAIPGKAFFGMEFIELDDGFRALLFQTISDGFLAVADRLALVSLEDAEFPSFPA